MKIEIVQLENVRSHLKSTVAFARGFNCLVGGLGCGKSSILFAIDFALFGDPYGRSYDYLLREDASSGKVTLQFVQNGKSYVISRGIKKRGKGINQDFDELKLFEGENLIASVKSEAVNEQLKAITGLDKDIFREIVWVRQEHLKELLNVQPRERQKRLDELFGLSDYEIAWNNLAGYGKEYEGEKRAYEKDPDVVGKERLGEEYNKAAEEFSLLEIELQEHAKKATDVKRNLEKAEAKLRELEEIKTRNEELKRKETKAIADLANIQETIKSLTDKIAAKKATIESLKKRLESMETQTESYKSELRKIGVSPDQPLETIRRYIATFDDQLSSLKAEHEAVLKNMQLDSKRISQLSAENRCPLCLQTLDEN